MFSHISEVFCFVMLLLLVGVSSYRMAELEEWHKKSLSNPACPQYEFSLAPQPWQEPN